MAADLALGMTQPMMVLGATVALMLLKTVVAFGIGRAAGRDTVDSLRLALALPQGSEFSFVLLGAAVAAGALVTGQAALATLVIAASMVLTPILFAMSERLLIPGCDHPNPHNTTRLKPRRPR